MQCSWTQCDFDSQGHKCSLFCFTHILCWETSEIIETKCWQQKTAFKPRLKHTQSFIEHTTPQIIVKGCCIDQITQLRLIWTQVKP